MRLLSTVLALTILVNGCSPNRAGPRTDPFTDVEVREAIARFEPGDEVRVRLVDGGERRGKLTCIDEELLCFGRVWIPWDRVVSVEGYGGEMGAGDFAILVTVCAVIVGAILISFAVKDFGR
jgi:hypothetical protein